MGAFLMRRETLRMGEVLMYIDLRHPHGDNVCVSGEMGGGGDGRRGQAHRAAAWAMLSPRDPSDAEPPGPGRCWSPHDPSDAGAPVTPAAGVEPPRTTRPALCFCSRLTFC